MPNIKMTIKLILSISIFLQVICSYGQITHNKIENILLNCLAESYKEKNVDINKELMEFEAYLIKNGTLKSASGQAYYDFYKQIVKLNDIPGVINYERFEAIYKLKPEEYYSDGCLTTLIKLDTIEIINSKYYQLTLKMKRAMFAERMIPSNIAATIISVLSSSDFDNPYYRAIALLTIANTSNSNKIPTTLLKLSQFENYSDFQKISIKATSKDEITLNGKTVNSELLKKELIEFIRENQSEHLIEFSTDKGSTYGFYLKVQENILEVYSKLRDEKAFETYKKSYSSLSENEQNEINTIYPTRIIE